MDGTGETKQKDERLQRDATENDAMGWCGMGWKREGKAREVTDWDAIGAHVQTGG